MPPIKLHIGGRVRLDGWINLGLQPGSTVDVVTDYDDLSQFADESVSTIFASYVLQRLSYQDARSALREWFRALSPGGELILSAPDLQLLSRYFTLDDLPKEARSALIHMTFGPQVDPNDFFASGFDFEILRSYLADAGFDAIRRLEKLEIPDTGMTAEQKLPESLNVRAYKPPIPPGIETRSHSLPTMATVQHEMGITRAMQHLSRSVECNTIVDLGCADGHFVLDNFELFRRPKIMNVDANPIYESILQTIADVTDGHYVVAAITDHDGELEITEGAHPYWDSVRPAGDPYWETVNNLVVGTRRVRAMTLDTLAREYRLPPPYFLKLDIQGAEEAALRGGKEFLRNTSAVLCEAILPDFAKIHRALEDADFALFDIMSIYRDEEGSLAYFYPIYVPRQHPAINAKRFWGPEHNAENVQLQDVRRRRALARTELLLDKLRKKRTGK